MNAVIESSKVGSANLKNAAVLSLASWKDESALNNLIELSKNSQLEERFKKPLIDGLIRLTSTSSLTNERKLLILRDAMDVAQTTAQKQSILRSIEATNTYNAMMFAGRYLDDAELGSVATNTVMNIALL